MAKKLQKASQDASWSKLPRIGAISVINAHFFDNTQSASGVKGQSDLAVKLFVYLRDENITLQGDHEWWRVVQLLEPKTFFGWAKKKHAQGGMTDDEYAIYEKVYSGAVDAQASGEFEIVRLGHIASPPGKQYFIGQLVYFTKRKDNGDEKGAVNLMIVNGLEVVLLDDWQPTKKRGKYRKSGTPVLYCTYDPCDFVGRTHREKEALEARGGRGGGLDIQAESLSTDPAELLNSFINRPGSGVF
ncbi:hypothetical protein [Microvirga sp. VF16]|uniref:hypothetical protein n=1 Tax=Microvirga sp. VF16 TaxID=2807101 RepID=UPI00193DFE49|nr:hypothetical protein [Microvirga sp. VF16]QRM28341.1 hypothetical protein JO965_19175 [Microvirga sp. VF16]